jgi:glycosyltransferase involved in cell wall biosynthesis
VLVLKLITMRLAILASHPVQYQIPLFRELATRPGLDLRVFFCWDFGVEQRHDPGFGRALKWDIPMLDGFEHEFLRNTSPDPGTHHWRGLVNPTACERISTWAPDAVVVHGYSHWTEQQVIVKLPRLGLRVVLRGESNLLRSRPLPLRLAKQVTLRWLLRHVSAVASIGSLNRAYWLHYGFPDEGIFLAPYTVDNTFFARRRDESRALASAWRSDMGIASGDPVVLFAAKLIPVKCCELLVRAFARGVEHGVLVIVGTGALEADLRALAQRLAPGRVHFTGFVNQSRMPAAYALGDVFVLPSAFEPWGLAVNEAMCLGLPVVVSDQVGAGPDLVSGKNGWVFRSGDETALAAVLREACASPERLRAMGQNSIDRIASWGIPSTADGILSAARHGSVGTAIPRAK